MGGANLCDRGLRFARSRSAAGASTRPSSGCRLRAFRQDCAVAAELHGLAALDPGLRKVYVVGDSGSGIHRGARPEGGYT